MITTEKIDDLLKYFHQEMNHIKIKGAQFATAYPNVAKKLHLHEDGSDDPHVERLIEAFAFVSAKLQRNIDQQFPEYTHNILGVLYPHLVSTIPPLSIAQLTPDMQKITSPHGFHVPKNTTLVCNLGENKATFKTAYSFTLWPIAIEDVGIVDLKKHGIHVPNNPAEKGLRIRLKSYGLPFNKLKLNHLDFYLHGERAFTHKIYDALLVRKQPVYIKSSHNKKAFMLSKGESLPLGFDKAQEILPLPAQSHPAYRLLMEYYAFPKKFYFIRVSGLDLSICDEICEIILPLGAEDIKEVSKKHIALGCVPITNLFSKKSEPLKLDHKSIKYKLCPDLRQEHSTEIHSITKVYAVDNKTGVESIINPYFSFYDHKREVANHKYWLSEKERSPLGGEDTYLSFVDDQLNEKVLQQSTIYADILCTNRNMTQSIPAGTSLHSTSDLPIKSVHTIMPFTRAKKTVDKEGAYWSFISHLNLNHLSLTSLGGESLKKLLSLYVSDEDKKVINGIVNVSQEHVIRRIGTDGWRGFIQGLQVTITVDDSYFKGVSLFLFGNVLRQFLALYASINSFVEVRIKIKGKKKIWKQWIPMTGRQHLL